MEKILISCDERLIRSHLDDIAMMISSFGIENNLRHPNSVLHSPQKIALSIRYFITDPNFLWNRKLLNYSIKDNIIKLFQEYKEDDLEELSLKDMFRKIFSSVPSAPNTINFLHYIDYICNIKRDRSDLKKTLVIKILDIIR